MQDLDAPLVVDLAVTATKTAFTITDASDPGMPLTYVNPAFTDDTGYTLADSLGRNCRFLQGPGTDPRQVAKLRSAIEAGRAATVTLLNYRKDGTSFWNQLAISPIRDLQGTVTHYVGVQTDVTDHVEADRARDAALGAERAAHVEAETARAEAQLAWDVADTARQAAERAGRHLALIAETTGLLSSTLDLEHSLHLLVARLVPQLADWAEVTLLRSGTLAPTSYRERRGEPVAARLVDGPIVPEAFARVLAGASGSVLRQRDLEPTAAGTGTELQRLLTGGSVMLLPLRARGRTLGVLCLVRGAELPSYSAEVLLLAAEIADRAGLAVDTAQLYAREHETALTLQRGLLPKLPAVTGLTLAATYLPAGDGAQVGGDWWDVFALPDGSTGLAIGDVMGHDISAAAAMGQLRSVLRTCAWLGDSPATVLDRMDRLVQGFEMAQLATCIYARLTTNHGQSHLTWSTAGHLPPIAVNPEGRARLLRGGLSAPIGVPVGDVRDEAVATVEPGTTIVFYTDGLVETRGSDIDTDIEKLRVLIDGHRPADGAQALVDRLTLGLPDPLTDDVAILVVSVDPST